jgi:hypothetical protein
MTEYVITAIPADEEDNYLVECSECGLLGACHTDEVRQIAYDHLAAHDCEVPS